ncbi:Vacuolar protein-sorting-associated protein 36 [Grifola frondosa]|uniref:Vacuolar protein-sorting-associated protein 36 n=1 Tax=Grifola frondosa TaxID=5627 RepID=A0A1C7MEA4_GRIFR|nr:Vacuolar protein-sorting-associated protein 36 [Grifola frondosa]
MTVYAGTRSIENLQVVIGLKFTKSRYIAGHLEGNSVCEPNMSLKRYTQKVDGTIPIQALLYEDEVLLASQEGVGIYDGSPRHTNVNRTRYNSPPCARIKNRLLRRPLHELVESHPLPQLPAAWLSVAINSSSNVAEPLTSPGPPTGDPAFDSWECEVCSYRNPPGLSPAASRVCALCGVPRSSIKAPISIAAKLSTSSAFHPLSSSLPSSSLNLGKMSISSSSSPLSFSPAPGSGAGSSEEIACPACTFLNHPSLPACEICGTSLPRKPHPPAKSAPTSRPVSPMISGEAEDDAADTPEKRMIRISFRKGGDKSFYNLLRRSLLGKGWEAKDARRTPQANVSAGSRTTGRSGINGILRNVESTAATSQTNMEDALQDLEALMVKWKDMVQLAQDLNERLTAVSASATSSTLTPSSATGVATFIRSSLAQLGLQMTNAPVTLDMIRDERKWIEELAKELAGVLQGGGGKVKGEGMMRKRGIAGLMRFGADGTAQECCSHSAVNVPSCPSTAPIFYKATNSHANILGIWPLGTPYAAVHEDLLCCAAGRTTSSHGSENYCRDCARGRLADRTY